MIEQSMSEKLFHKYEFIAVEYAKKIFNNERLAMMKDDIMQEFRIKLYQVILAYGRSVDRFQENGIQKPIPLQFYIRSSMNNFKVDFIKSIESNKSKVLYIKNNEDHDYASYRNDMVNLDFTNNILQINGFDLLESLKGVEKSIFCMYCKGVEMDQLMKRFDKIIDVKKLVKTHTKYLADRKHLFYPENKTEIFVTNYSEEG